MSNESPISAPDTTGDKRDDKRPLAAEIQFLLIAIALVLVIMLAGVPGTPRVAGDGSDALRHGWAAQHAAESAATDDAGLDPSAPQR